MSENLAELTVSELATGLKQTIEAQFSYVKIRGEISGFKRHSSGHLYFSLKDDKALINAIMWRGTTSRLNFSPEDGLEVLATGKVTTYMGRSQYQIVVDNMQPAGVGALMALLEKRKAQFAAEGLFAQERKKPLPFLPKVIAILTSETGAVIRDILHRLQDRYMPHILLLPIAVQGELAAKQLAYGIKLFNKIDDTSNLPKPDLIIVARGGGSIEDLWSFNEEIVVRSIAASEIPVISAVGHETDFTLCDFVADLRAPTPTAAAEMAVPIKQDLLVNLNMIEARLLQALKITLDRSKDRLQKIDLPPLDRLLSEARQKFDFLAERLPIALQNIVALKKSSLQEKISLLRAEPLKQKVLYLQKELNYTIKQQEQTVISYLKDRKNTIITLDRMLEATSYKSILKRGFIAAKTHSGEYITQKPDHLDNKTPFILEFHDGSIEVVKNG